MASQNTVSRDKLSSFDKKNFTICGKIVDIIVKQIPTEEDKRQFYNEYGRTHQSRDAGQGRGAGKLQRDALTTRGRQAKAPFSNRNLRWHPLVVSNSRSSYFKPIDEVKIGKGKLLLFKIGNKTYKPKDVYKFKLPYCITIDKWQSIVDKLKDWNQDDWIKNWCTIPAVEYCTPKDAIESFAILGLSIACSFFKVDLKLAYKDLYNFIKKNVKGVNTLPDCSEDLLLCPLCLTSISAYPCCLQPRQRPEIWKPAWQKSKRGEGEDESLQLTHVKPLREGEICHTARLTRYGHRWCNVSMTDHSVEDTVDFMRAICHKHSSLKSKQS